MNLENLVASIVAHISTYQRPFEILGWVQKPPGVGRAHPARSLATPVIFQHINPMWFSKSSVKVCC